MADLFDETLVEETNIWVSASEVASAIGEHYYQPREETLRKIWKRTDQQSFYFAMAQNYKKDVAKIISSNFPFQATFPWNMDLESDDGKRIFLAVLKEITLNNCAGHIFRDVKRFLDRQEFRDTKQIEILKENGLTEEVKAATINLCVNETKKIETVVEEIVKKSGIQTEEVKRALTSQITKNRGTKLENQAVKKFAEENRVKVRQIPGKLFVKCMESDGISWGLNGRVDGLTNDKVIEVKNRRNHFMCPMYDYIQIQAYLFLTDKKDAILLERLHGENKETELTFDKLFWDEYVTPMLGQFVKNVVNSIDYHTSSLLDTQSCQIELKIDVPNEQNSSENKNRKITSSAGSESMCAKSEVSCEKKAIDTKVVESKINTEAKNEDKNKKVTEEKTNSMSGNDIRIDDSVFVGNNATCSENNTTRKSIEVCPVKCNATQNYSQVKLPSNIDNDEVILNTNSEILSLKRTRGEDRSKPLDKSDEIPPKLACVIN